MLVGSVVLLAGLGALQLAHSPRVAEEASQVNESSSLRAAGSELVRELNDARQRLRTREHLLADAQRRLADAQRRLDSFLDELVSASNTSSVSLSAHTAQEPRSTDDADQNVAELIRQREQLLEKMTLSHPAVQELDRQIALAGARRPASKPAKASTSVLRPAASPTTAPTDRRELDRLRANVSNAERQAVLNEADQRSALIEVVRLEESVRLQDQTPVPTGQSQSQLISQSAPKQWGMWLVVLVSAIAGAGAALLGKRKGTTAAYPRQAQQRRDQPFRREPTSNRAPQPHFLARRKIRQTAVARNKRRAD